MQRSLDADTVHFEIQEGFLSYDSCLLRLDIQMVAGLQSRSDSSPAAQTSLLGLCLLRFLVSERALLLLFSDGTVQISGRGGGDRAHLVLSGGGEELQLTVWEGGQPRTSYPRGALQSPGCTPQARPHLVHALHMLQSI
ncbi:Inactive serine/threonine-protein kinase PLK5 [Vulpes lagopus]